MDRFVKSQATTKYSWSRNRPEVDFHKAALKRHRSHFFNFHFQIPGSLATTKYPWSPNRPEVNSHKENFRFRLGIPSIRSL